MINCQLIFRNIKNNIHGNVLLAVGIIFNFSFVYCFLFLEAAIESAASLGIAWNYGSMLGAVSTCTIVSMLSGFFLIMSIAFPYIKGRIREYSLLMILGIEKKEMYLLLGIEYVIIWGITLFAGFLLGIALSVLVYVILILTGYPAGEVHWLALGCDVCGKVMLLSVCYVAGTLAYLLVRMDNRDLSELAAETMKPDKMKNMHNSMGIGAVGLVFVLFSLVLQFSSRYLLFFKGGEDDRLLIAFVVFTIGMYLLVMSGMSVVLNCFKRSKSYYYKNALSLRSVMYRVSAYKNTIFAIVLINFAVLFSVGNNVIIFSDEERDYSWRYPHDFIGRMTEEDAEKWERFSRENGEEKGLICVPFVDVESETRAKFIGISESAYKKITSKHAQLEKNQMLLFVQHDKSESGKALEDWEGEENIAFRFGEEIKQYEIKEKEVDVLTIGGLLINAAVFEDGEHKELLSKRDVSDFLVIQDFKEGREYDMEQKVQRFKEKNPQISCITKIEALNIENLVDRIYNIINIFCVLCLTLAGLTMLSVKLFFEITEFKKKYMFLSDVGMEREQIKKEAGKEIRNVIFIPAVLGIFMAGVYKMNILGRYIRMNPRFHFYAESGMPAFIWEMSRDWLFMVIVFCFVQLLYGAYIISFIRKRVVLTF